VKIVISMLILPQRTQNNAFNVFIWASLFVGLGMQMCLYSIEWYARQNCPRFVVKINFICFYIYINKIYLEWYIRLFYTPITFLSG